MATDVTTSFGTPAILRSTQAANRTIEANKEAVLNNRASAHDIFANFAKGIEQSIDDAFTVKQVDGIAKAKVEQATRDAVLAAGASPDMIVSLTKQAQIEYEQAQAARDVILKKESVGFFDNPIEYLINQFTLSSDYGVYNAHVDKHNNTANRISALTAAASDIGQLENAVKESDTLDQINRRARLATHELQKEARTVELEALRYDQNALTELARMDAQQIENQYKAASLIRSDQDMAMRQKEFAQRSEAFKLQLEQRKEDRATIEVTVDALNRGRAAQGLAPLDEKTALSILKSQGVAGDVARNQLNSGWTELTTQQVDSNGIVVKQGTRMLGPDLQTVAESIIHSNSPGANPAQKTLFDKIRKYADEASMANAALKVPEVAAIAAKKLKDEITAHQGNVPIGEKSLLEVQPTSVNLLKVPELAKLPFVQKVLIPNSDQKGSETPTAIFLRGMAEVKAGNMTEQELVKGISAYYSKAVEVNAALRDFNAAGIAAPTNYKTPLDIGTSIFKARPVDLTNPAEISAVIAAEKFKQKFGTGGFSSF